MSSGSCLLGLQHNKQSKGWAQSSSQYSTTACIPAAAGLLCNGHLMTCPATHWEEDSASQGQKIKQQDVSSWLTGIQEVPLSLQYKMRNIDETEAAKKRLLADAAPE